ncbi:unnamed protein product [Cuscuta epithymum]|uniref:Pollen Ole e 1 allergen and extensin family protein n=1 Tax=Cuscuta epithymum TaxID=186058 RepID=A0AAV0D648_9ASTE|nr:unnamed protein product [Cuscuta epithymum]
MIRKMALVFASMIFLAFLESPAAATVVANPLVELSGREELVVMGGYGEDKLSTVLIDGSVLCHPCDHLNRPNKPLPLSGASVGVSCNRKGKMRKTSCEAHNTTDEQGYFLIDLPSHLHAIPNLEKTCTVRVVHLPKNSACHPNFIKKQKAISLTSNVDGIRTYTSHKITLTTPNDSKTCSERQVRAAKRARA